MEEGEEPADQMAGGGSLGAARNARRATAAPDQNAILRSRP
jgi:hypothetical protein